MGTAVNGIETIEKIERARHVPLRNTLDVMHPSFAPLNNLLKIREESILGYFNPHPMSEETRYNYLKLFEVCNDNLKQFLGL